MYRNDFVRCGFCNNLYKGVAAVKAHIRQAHGKNFDQNNWTHTEPPPGEEAPAQQGGAGGVPDFTKMLQDALAPLQATLAGIKQPPQPKPPVMPTMPQVAPAQPAPAYTQATLPMTEETGQRLCQGLECFSKTAEILQQAAQGISQGRQGQADAHEHEHEDGDEHGADQRKAVEAQIDSFIHCPDGVCSKILRRKILYNWDEVFPGLSLRRGDGSALIAPSEPQKPEETKPEAADGAAKAGETAAKTEASKEAEGETKKGEEAGTAAPEARTAGDAAEEEHDDDDPFFGI